MDELQLAASGGPVVMIHRGWGKVKDKSRNLIDQKTQPRQQNPIQQEPQPASVGNTVARSNGTSHLPKVISLKSSRDQRQQCRNFEFVNATKSSRDNDPIAHMRIRAHETKDVHAKQRTVPTEVDGKDGKEHPAVSDDEEKKQQRRHAAILDKRGAFFEDSIHEERQLVPFDSQPLLKSTVGYFDAEPQLHKAISYLNTVASAMYPMELHFRFNPLSPESWFQTALADAALFHALLYASSVYFGLVEGVTESKEATLHMNRAARLINGRLDRPAEAVTDSTIGAVSCLAMGEAVRGHVDTWKIHMSGLRQMIKMRGGFSALNAHLKRKVYRVDLVGAVDYMSHPHFVYEKTENPSLYLSLIPSGLGPCSPTSTEAFLTSGIDLELIAVLQELYRFSNAVDFALAHSAPLNPDLFVEDSYLIRHGLLSFSPLTSRCADTRHVEESIRLGALIYVKDLLREFPRSVVGMEVLIQSLKLELEPVSYRQELGPLLLWLFCIGGMYCVSGADRVWFVVHLVRVKRLLNLFDWNDTRAQLKRLFWIEIIHDASGRLLWEEVETTGSILTSS